MDLNFALRSLFLQNITSIHIRRRKFTLWNQHSYWLLLW